MTRIVLSALLILSAATNAQTPVAGSTPAWRIDANHSELTFTVRHLISRVRGQFNTWNGAIVADPGDWSKASVDVTVQTTSIDTNNERRDTHLRTSDFFEADKYPTIAFKSTAVTRTGDAIRVAGNLTMKGVTKPVVLTGKFLGATGAPGKRRMGFEASTTINRMDYGVSWNRAAEGGGMTLGDEVTISIAISAIEQEPVKTRSGPA